MSSVTKIHEYVANITIHEGGGAVDSVNGETGVVELDHTDVDAAAAVHGHAIADIDELGDALDGKASTSHTHTLSQISDAGTAAALNEEDVLPSTAIVSHVAQADPHAQYQLENSARQIIRVSTRAEATDARAGLGAYDDTKPFASVQAALNASAAGDTIVVEPGSYTLSARLTGFNGRVLDLRDATLTANIAAGVFPDGVIRAEDGETLSIIGTGTIRNTGTCPMVTMKAGSRGSIRAARIEATGSSAPAVMSRAVYATIHADEISSTLYDAIVLLGGGETHVVCPRIYGGGNCLAVESADAGAELFVWSQHMPSAGEALNEESEEAATVYLTVDLVDSPTGFDDGSLGSVCTWYVRAKRIIGDIFTTHPNFHLLDAQFETLARRNAANGYAGLNESSKLNGAQQAYGTGANTACEGNDARLSDARTPTSHTHGNITNAGAIGSSAGAPIITGFGGVLTAGEFGPLAGNVCEGNDWRLGIIAAASVPNTVVSVASTSPVDLVSAPVTVAAGDMYELQLLGTIKNNSGGTRSYTVTWSLGALSGADTTDAALPDSATQRGFMEIHLNVAVASASSASLVGQSYGSGLTTAGSGVTIGANLCLHSWNESAGNLTGNQTLKIQMHSSNASGTQEFTVFGWALRKINAP